MLCGDAALENIAEMLYAQTPQEIIGWALQTFEKRLAVVTAFQAEGLVVLDMAYRLDPTIRVMTIDTGRLPHDTYAFIERVRQHYPALQLDILFPDYHDVEPMVQQHGINLFYQAVSLRHLCCHVRKVHPFQRAIQHLDAWFTGLRREPNTTRASIRTLEADRTHAGKLTINPLAIWTKEEVWEYIRTHNVPYHPLYDQGYTSIGCAPCTRPTNPDEDDRAGRWCWEEQAPKECGLHFPLELASPKSRP